MSRASRASRASRRPDPIAASRPAASPTPPPAPPATPSLQPAVIVVDVAGMTCRTCEQRIARHVRRIPNVSRAAASASRGQVAIEVTGPVSDADIAAAIEAAGYSVGRSPWLSRETAVWATAGIGLVVVVGIAVIAQATGFTELASGAGDLASGGLLVALLLGLAAGVSTCLALTGGLVLALSAAFAARRGDGNEASAIARIRPAGVFVVGRIAGYALFGALLGAIGASVALPPTLVAMLMVAVAVVMTILGVRLTGVSPRIAAWSPTLPMGLSRRLGVHEGSATAYSDTRAAVLGAATFFLPCGFTQAVQVYALSTGSPLTAGAIMAVFAIGTAPGLLAVGGLPMVLPGSLRPALLRVVGVVVLGFAMVNASAGLRLAGFTPPSVGGSATAVTPDVIMEDGVQVLRTFQRANGYAPAEAALYAGVPTRWIVESLEGGSCAIFLEVPSLGVSVMLREGDNAIDLPPLQPGKVAYSCSMGMYGGTLNVVQAQQGMGPAAPLG